MSRLSTWIAACSSDARMAWRILRRKPGFSSAAILMLTLGIGTSVAMYSVLQGVVLSSLPYPGGDRVVTVSAHNPQQSASFARLTMAEAERFAQDDAAFDAFGYFDWAGITVLDGQRPREVASAFVSAGFFPALGIAPLHGRTFTPDDMRDGVDAVVLSYTEWERLTGSDPAVIGRNIDTTADGRLLVIGVMPPQFAYPIADIGAWRPFQLSRLQRDSQLYRDRRFLDAVARLPATLSPGVVQSRMQATMKAVRVDFGHNDAGWRARATPLLQDSIGEARDTLWASFGVALLVLLIACANVAILLDARQLSRRHEQAVSQAIGAGDARLRRGMLMELGLLGLAGALFGTLLAGASLELLRHLALDSVPRAEEITLDPGVLAFALALGIATPLLAALFGALRLRAAPIDAIRGGGRGQVGNAASTRWLPVLGVALSTLGLFAATALIASLVRIGEVDPGFHGERVHALQLFRNGGPEQWIQFSDRLRTRLAADPAVDAVAITSAAPLSSIGHRMTEVRLAARSEPEPYEASLRRVSPGYLDLLGIPLLAGRDFEGADRRGTELVAIVSREFARRAFDGRDPVGQSVAMPIGERGWLAHRIVGVSGDVRNAGLRRSSAPEVLVPFAQTPWVGVTFLVRAAHDDAALAARLREAMWELDPMQATTREYALSDDLVAEMRPARFFARTVAGFALCALVLAALGVYAVAAQHQQQRRAEFGLRLAVGAAPARLARQSLSRSLRGAALGVLAGTALGIVALPWLRSQLLGFDAGYIPWLAGAVLAIAATVVLAALPAALRSARTSPIVSLRHD